MKKYKLSDWAEKYRYVRNGRLMIYVTNKEQAELISKKLEPKKGKSNV